MWVWLLKTDSEHKQLTAFVHAGLGRSPTCTPGKLPQSFWCTVCLSNTYPCLLLCALVYCACRLAESMEPPSLPRTVSPIWSDIPAYAGDAEQMEEYLSGELTRYVKSAGHPGIMTKLLLMLAGHLQCNQMVSSLHQLCHQRNNIGHAELNSHTFKSSSCFCYVPEASAGRQGA